MRNGRCAGCGHVLNVVWALDSRCIGRRRRRRRRRLVVRNA